MVWLPQGLPQAVQGKVTRLLSSPRALASLLRILPEEGPMRPLLPLLPLQDKILRALEAGETRILVVKARRTGSTTICKAVMFSKWLQANAPETYLVYSMKADNAAQLLDEAVRWHEGLPEALRRPLDRRARGALRLKDCGASLEAKTARSIGGVRGMAAHGAVISEAGFAADLDEVLAQVVPALVPGAPLIVESTMNSPADGFGRMIQDPPPGWVVLTEWWHETPKARMPVPPDFVLSREEAKIQATYGLDLEQLAWRRDKIAALANNEFKFARDYPACREDLFLAASGTHFATEVLSDVVRSPRKPSAMGQEATEWLSPVSTPGPYVMGVDTALGTGGDYAALWVVCTTTKQPIFSWRSNKASPAEQAEIIVRVAAKFKEPLVLVESNNTGHAVLLALQTFGYTNLWLDPASGKPWGTTAKSKVEAYESLRQALTGKFIERLDDVTWIELRGLRAKEGLAPSHPDGAHDDSAMALALAYRAGQDSDWLSPKERSPLEQRMSNHFAKRRRNSQSLWSS